MKSRITRVVSLAPGQFSVQESIPMIDVLHVEEGELAGWSFILSSFGFEDNLPTVIIFEQGWMMRTVSAHQQGGESCEVCSYKPSSLGKYSPITS